MAEYHLYVLNDWGQIRQAAHILHADTDAEAMQRAQEFVDGRPVEVWEKDRRVGTITPPKRKTK